MHDLEIVRASDGSLRLSLRVIRRLRFRHLISGLVDDHEPLLVSAQCGSHTTIMGYTEWVSDGINPVISIGWDWHLRLSCEARYQRIGLPRSNVMLVNQLQQEVGWHQNGVLLAAVVDSWQWIDTTGDAIRVRHG
jgi:hypothetical protein